MQGSFGFLKSTVIAAIVLFLNVKLPAQSKSYDGVWWQMRTASEQEGFIFGYGDCYAASPDQRVRVSLDDQNLQIAVGVFYQAHQSQRTRPVAQVLRDIWAGHVSVPYAKQALPGGGWRERHGYFDGLWWKGSSNPEQLGFVEGYATCFSSEHRKARAFSLEPEKYVSLLTAWYSLNGDESFAARRQAEKIADVLPRFSNAGLVSK